MKKIPCVVLVYFDARVIRTALEALVREADRLDITVVENQSDSTETEIRPYVLGLLRQGLVSRYFHFHRNISNNAIETVLDSGHIDIAGADYVMVTDGDLLPETDGWLTELQTVLDRHREVFACGVTLSVSNLPVEVYPPAAAWAPAGTERDGYVEEGSGANLLLLRGPELAAFLTYRRPRGTRLLDFEIAGYCRDVLKKKWARTRHSTARHLTWDSYQDLEHPYTKMKLARGYEGTWAHHRYSAYTLHTREAVRTYRPFRKIALGHLAAVSARIRVLVRGRDTRYDAWDWKKGPD